MARVAVGFLLGTHYDLTFYLMDGSPYVRMKSSLSRKKVKYSPRFVRTMQSAGELGRASRLASKIYRELSKEQKKMVFVLYKKMTGVAKIAFKYGKSEAEAEQEVREYLMREGVVKEEVEEKKVAGVVRREANSRWQEVSSSKYTLPGVAVSDRCRRIVQRKRTGWKRKRWKKGRLGSGKAPPHSFAGSALTVAD